MSRRHHAEYATFTLIIIFWFPSLHCTISSQSSSVTNYYYYFLVLLKKAISGGPFNKNTYIHTHTGIDINELNSTILLYLLLAFKF